MDDRARCYSFTHGGKDGHPYPIDRQTYDGTIAFLEAAVRHGRLGERDRLVAFRRLAFLGPDRTVLAVSSNSQ